MGMGGRGGVGDGTAGIIFQASLSGTLPPKSAIIGYATERALLISDHLSSDAVSAFRKAWVLIRLWDQHSLEART